MKSRVTARGRSVAVVPRVQQASASARVRPPHGASRGARALALALGLATLVLTLLAWTLMALSWTAPVPDAWGFRGFSGIFALSFGSVGYLIATRRPGNAIGWLFVGAGLMSAVQVLATEYGSYALFAPGAAAPAGAIGAWVNGWIWVPIVVIVVVPAFLLFPDGALPSPRWRAVLWLAAASAALAMTVTALTPGPMQTFDVPNPVGVEACAT